MLRKNYNCKYVVRLTQEERDELEGMLRRGRAAVARLQRAHVLLKADAGPEGPGPTDEQVADALDVSRITVHRVRKAYVEEGLKAAIERRPARTVPVVHTGAISSTNLKGLIGPSRFDSQFEDPITKRIDRLMEGLYLRTEADGVVTGRAKLVRTEFVEKIKQSTHWQHQVMVANQLADGVDIWS